MKGRRDFCSGFPLRLYGQFLEMLVEKVQNSIVVREDYIRACVHLAGFVVICWGFSFANKILACIHCKYLNDQSNHNIIHTKSKARDRAGSWDHSGGIIRKTIWILLTWDPSWSHTWHGETFGLLLNTWEYHHITLAYKGKPKATYAFWTVDLKCSTEDDC